MNLRYTFLFYSLDPRLAVLIRWASKVGYAIPMALVLLHAPISSHLLLGYLFSPATGMQAHCIIPEIRGCNAKIDELECQYRLRISVSAHNTSNVDLDTLS